MKAPLLALSLSACGILLADGEIPRLSYHPADSCAEDSCCPYEEDPSEPLYIPDSVVERRDARCFPPQFYDLEEACGLALSGGLLYWYGRETNLLYAIQFKMVNALPSPNPSTPVTSIEALPRKYEYLDATWALGARAGLGFDYACDGWDALFEWTYYNNQTAQNKAAGDTSAPFPQEGSTSLLGLFVYDNYLTNPFYSTAIATWKVTFNQFDWELGRKYWLSRSFALRPFAGLRAGFTQTTFMAQYLVQPQLTAPSQINQINTNKLRNKYWGVGLLAGIQPTYYICDWLAFFGNLDGALIWGEFEERDRANYLGTSTAGNQLVTHFSNTNTATGSYFRMQGVLDLGLGFRFENTWCCDRFRTAIDIGWEHHIWINHGLRHRPIGRIQQQQSSTLQLNYFRDATAIVSDLVMGGLTVHARFDF